MFAPELGPGAGAILDIGEGAAAPVAPSKSSSRRSVAPAVCLPVMYRRLLAMCCSKLYIWSVHQFVPVLMLAEEASLAWSPPADIQQMVDSLPALALATHSQHALPFDITRVLCTADGSRLIGKLVIKSTHMGIDQTPDKPCSSSCGSPL